MADVTRNGALRAADPAKLREATARTKIGRYREGYATRTGDTYAFLHCVMSTSGRMHGEFLRLLFIIAHRRTERWFKQMGDDYHCEDLSSFARVSPRHRRRPSRRKGGGGRWWRLDRGIKKKTPTGPRGLRLDRGLGSPRQCALCPLLLVSATRLPNKTRPQSQHMFHSNEINNMVHSTTSTRPLWRLRRRQQRRRLPTRRRRARPRERRRRQLRGVRRRPAGAGPCGSDTKDAGTPDQGRGRRE